jgi:hypothetical protein
LLRLKLTPGLTNAQAAEKAELDAFYEKEDRDYRRKSELLYKNILTGLTDAERIEYAELQERYPPNPNRLYGDLAARLKIIAKGEDCVTSEPNRAAAAGRPAPHAAEKLKPASPDLMTDAELMPDEHNAERARSEFDLLELVGRIGNLYTRVGLSPPFMLRDAVTSWGGLCLEEIVAVIEKHLQDCGQFYIAGAGDQHFHMVRSAISKALEAKYPRDRLGVAPKRPRRRRAGRIR